MKTVRYDLMIKNPRLRDWVLGHSVGSDAKVAKEQLDAARAVAVVNESNTTYRIRKTTIEELPW